jgi:predicted transcriptional regulator
MLGSGIPQNQVALALGITESAVSQWMSREDFATKVADLRFQNLNRHTQIDDKYTELEEKLQAKLEKVLPLMTKPRDVVMALTAINSTKRRGAQIADTGAGKTSQVVNLTLPISIVQQYISNSNNQIVEVIDESGKSKSLITASSSSLDRLSEEVLGEGNSSQKLLAGREVRDKEESSNVASQELLKQLSAKIVPTGSREGILPKGTDARKVTIEDL